MRIGLFGGSFDPVHNGHLAVATACREAAELDDVWFVPTAVQPHKPSGPIASNQQRVAMLELAGVRHSLVEIERGGVSYTVDTLRELGRLSPADQWFLLMGADTLHDLPNWREPSAILQMASPLVVGRPGEPPPDFACLSDLVDEGRLQSFRKLHVEMAPVDTSSSDIRRRIATGQSIETLCPTAVVNFIARNNLYAG